MALSVIQIIAIIAPQFSSDTNLANTIVIATQRTSEEAFGENYTYAIALRTAHILTLRDMNKNGVNSALGGVVGAITGKSEGDLSLSFEGSGGMTGTTGLQSSDLKLTRYGLELLGLIAGNIPGISCANFSNVKEASLTEVGSD